MIPSNILHNQKIILCDSIPIHHAILPVSSLSTCDTNSSQSRIRVFIQLPKTTKTTPIIVQLVCSGTGDEYLNDNTIVLPSWLKLESFGLSSGDCVHVDLVNENEQASLSELKTIHARNVLQNHGWIPTSLGLVKSLNRKRGSETSRSRYERELVEIVEWEDVVRKGLCLMNGVIRNNTIIPIRVGKKVCALQISIPNDTNNSTNAFFQITPETQINIIPTLPLLPPPSFIGYQDQRDELKQYIIDACHHSDLFQKLGIPPTKGILLSGAFGVGKKSLLSHLVEYEFKDYGYHFYPVQLTQSLLEMTSAQANGITNGIMDLERVFAKARLSPPAVIGIMDLELFVSKDRKIDEEEQKLLDLLVAEMNRLEMNDEVVVVGVVSDAKYLPVSMKALGMFHHEVKMDAPKRELRERLLYHFLSQLSVDGLTEALITEFSYELSHSTPGYTARDIYLLVQTAYETYLSRKETSSTNPASLEDRLASLSITDASPSLSLTDFDKAFEYISPTQAIEFETRKPRVSWNDIGGFSTLRQRMQQVVEWPIKHPDTFERLGVNPPGGMLLFGPSGCGKTTFVHALANASCMNFISVQPHQILSKYLGESELALRKLFRFARQMSPCIVFMDNLEQLGQKRQWQDSDGGTGVQERLLSTLLNEMDGVSERGGVFVIGCTTRPDLVDDALLRPGRLDQLVYLGLPELEDRVGILNVLKKSTEWDPRVDVEDLAEMTDKFSPADLIMLVRTAAIHSHQTFHHEKFIEQDSFWQALSQLQFPVLKRYNQMHMNVYEKYQAKTR